MIAELDAKAYADALPWPHAVINGFLPAPMADAAAEEFPEARDRIWSDHGREFSNGRARKLEMAKTSAMPVALQRVVSLVHSPAMLRRLRGLTGFDDLTPDASLYGGGLNLVEPGGFLDVHADFNWNDDLKAYRTVNLIVYLNRGWKPGDGGELELWSDGECRKKIEPRLNRAVLFTTTQAALHGYGPVQKTRRSMNFYFYRARPASGIAAHPHRTMWANIPSEKAG